jgi:hypothetical protein
MGFYVRATRKGLAHGLDLNVGNDRGHACESHQTQDALRGQDTEPLFKFPSQEQVAGKQWRG